MKYVLLLFGLLLSAQEKASFYFDFDLLLANHTHFSEVGEKPNDLSGLRRNLTRRAGTGILGAEPPIKFQTSFYFVLVVH